MLIYLSLRSFLSLHVNSFWHCGCEKAHFYPRQYNIYNFAVIFYACRSHIIYLIKEDGYKKTTEIRWYERLPVNNYMFLIRLISSATCTSHVSLKEFNFNSQYTHITIGCRFWTLGNNEQQKNWMSWWEMGEFKSCVCLHKTNLCLLFGIKRKSITSVCKKFWSYSSQTSIFTLWEQLLVMLLRLKCIIYYFGIGDCFKLKKKPCYIIFFTFHFILCHISSGDVIWIC